MARTDLAHWDPRLLDIAAAVADGHVVDWAGSPPSPRDELTLDALRAIATIADALTPSRELTLAELTSGEPPSRSLLPAGHQWGALEILEHVGSGRFGDVYRAWDPALARDVALKLLPPQPAADGDDNLVVREGQLMARVRHPNVVTVYGAQRLHGQAGLWMEFVHGRTLRDELLERGPFTASELILVGRQLTGALAAVHDAHLVHRDVKAQNVMRADDGRVVLGDFGIGQERGTASTQIAGSPAYVAPEILRGAPASPQSDIYSLGALLFYLASGSYPFRGRSWQDIRDAQTRRERTRVADVRSDLPSRLTAVIERALEPDLTQRFASAAELGSALLAAGGQGSVARFAATVNARIRRVRTPAIVAAGILAALVVTGMLWSRREPPLPRAASPSDGVSPSKRTVEARRPAVVAPATSPTAAAESVVTTPTVPLDETVPPVLESGVPVLNTGDTVLVTAFDNRTGEPLLDEVLAYAFSHDLRSSPFIKAASPLRVQDALRALDLPAETALTLAHAQTVAQRDAHVRLILDGHVQKNDSGYLLTLQLFEPGSNLALWREETQAANHSALLATIRDRALALRAMVGEPRASVDAERKRLRPALTTVPAVLRNYLDARSEVDADVFMMNGSRRPLGERIAATEGRLRAALRDDPDFAPAGMMLAWVLREGSGEPEEFQSIAAHAKKLAGSVGASQQLADGLHLDLSVIQPRSDAGLPVKNMEALGQASRLYEAALIREPQNRFVELLLQRAAHLAGYEIRVGTLHAAYADARPRHYAAHSSAAWALFREGDYTGARRYAARAESFSYVIRKGLPGWTAPVVASARLLSAYAAFMEGQTEVAARELERVASSLPTVSTIERAALESPLVDLSVTLGQLRNARKLATSPLQRATIEAAGLDPAEASNALAAIGAGPGGLEQFGYVWLLISARRLDEAEHQLGLLPATLTQPPMAWRATALAGMLAKARGRLEDALPLLERAVSEIDKGAVPPQLDAAVGFVYEALAAALVERGEWDRARTIVQSGLKMRALIMNGSSVAPALAANLSLRALLVRINRQRQPLGDGGALLGLRPLVLAADHDHPVRLLVDDVLADTIKQSTGREGRLPAPAPPAR